MKFELKPLPYKYDALEPVIDSKTMEIHYSKHHQGYVNKLNAALEKHEEVTYRDLQELLLHVADLPNDIQTAVRNNGGGHFNHTLFWEALTPNKTQPSKELLQDLTQTFGGLEQFKELFEQTGAKQFGSGWVWLIKTKEGVLKVVSTANQDTPLQLGTPLLGVDVWEHAYYLKHQNKRADYLHQIWDVINWEFVSENYKK